MKQASKAIQLARRASAKIEKRKSAELLERQRSQSRESDDDDDFDGSLDTDVVPTQGSVPEGRIHSLELDIGLMSIDESHERGSIDQSIDRSIDVPTNNILKDSEKGIEKKSSPKSPKVSIFNKSSPFRQVSPRLNTETNETETNDNNKKIDDNDSTTTAEEEVVVIPDKKVEEEIEGEGELPPIETCEVDLQLKLGMVITSSAIVGSVTIEGQAEKSGIKPGCKILSVEKNIINNLDDIKKAVAQLKLEGVTKVQVTYQPPAANSKKTLQVSFMFLCFYLIELCPPLPSFPPHFRPFC